MAIRSKLSILTASEQDELYSPPVFSEDDQRFFFSPSEADWMSIRRGRDRRTQCMQILLQGYFLSKPVILQLRFHSIKDDLRFIATHIIPGKSFRAFTMPERELRRLYERVLVSTGYQRWSDEIHRQGLEVVLDEEVRSWSYPRHLFDCAIEFLSAQKIAIPGYSTLQSIIAKALNNDQKRLKRSLFDACPSDLKRWLAELTSKDGASTFRRLRDSARNQSGKELEKELAVHQIIAPRIGSIKQVVSALELSPMNQKHYAERVDYYGAKLTRHDSGDQQLYLLCYLNHRWQIALERIAEGFLHQVRQIKQKAVIDGKEHVYQDWQLASKNVSKAAQVLSLFVDESIDPELPFRSVKEQALMLLPTPELTSVMRFLNEQKQLAEEGQWLFLDQNSGLRTRLLRRLFCCLKFEGSDKVARLVVMLDRLRQALLEKSQLTATVPELTFITKASRQWLLDNEEKVDVDRLEWYLYLQIQNRLNGGQLTLPEVIKYRPLEDDLQDQESWLKDKKLLLEQTQQEKLTAKPGDLIDSMSEELSAKLIQVSESLKDTDNRNVVLRQKDGKRHWRLPTTNKAILLHNPFFQQMPTTALVDALRMVDRDTQFIDCFEHVLGKANPSRLQETDLFAILIANATHQGIYSLAQISDRSYEQMRAIQANFLRPETLHQANDIINNATARLPIFKYYNIQEDMIHASADGQKFESKRETFKTRYSSKYFGAQKGVSAISLNANHAAVNARVIGANEHESHFIYDLLKNNSSEIIPDVLSTDSHGINHVNFALLDLFGYRFAPRYAQFSKVINEMFDISEDSNNNVLMKLKKAINTRAIKEYWDTIQRIAVSLHKRTTDQATLVRKLSGYKNNHPLLEALSEYNRLVKAQYLLDYIDDASLRNHVQRALNRGEAYHQLRRALSDINGDRFRGNSDEEIHLWNECARLVSNAIIYFNSSVLSELLDNFEKRGKKDWLEIVKKSSPVAWFNINFKGTYLFDDKKKLPSMKELMKSIEGYQPVQKSNTPP